VVEVIIVPKSITACIVWGIDIDELHFACEFLPERVESDEVVSLYEEIFLEFSILIPELYLVRILDSAYTVRVNLLESSQYLRISQDIDICSIECLVEEFFLSSRLFIRHTSFEDAVLVWKREDNISGSIDKGGFRSIEESYFVGIVSDPSLAERIIHNKSTYKSKC
jgi:hypothetical protein